MTRLYERLAGLNALVGVLALVVGLAAVPQVSRGAVAPNPVPGCTGVCTVGCSGLTRRCSDLINSACVGIEPCYCTGSQYNDSNGDCIGCGPGSCL